eukprot:SM000282S10600  [mRNA]  locus=s282:126712:128602:+ [translate_table: standard]
MSLPPSLLSPPPPRPRASDTDGPPCPAAGARCQTPRPPDGGGGGGCSVILFPIAVTYYITSWFIAFFDSFFSPLYKDFLGIEIPGLGFLTSFVFIFFVGVFVSSWVGSSVLWVGEWLIKRMPLVRHIYSASKQISVAISPDTNTQAFKEVVIIRHPRLGEYAFGFITSSFTLQHDNAAEELHSVYVPTNHLYIGDIFLVNAKDIIRPNLSVREGIGLTIHFQASLVMREAVDNLLHAEIVVSGGMSMPAIIHPLDERAARAAHSSVGVL